ncbi:sugar-binding transcriptional regulator [Cytobacillus purgationiresistens]|uniref:DNA-binding transcriptional regulator LsrR (DeoR family) n=1 Tax=Cytobacillus purgationiresistens TaxID=863449 RepID=A0ABU0AGG4_9BACI|nr:sugar-binding transcriptional regulator [Cytobacillus purgationiresistens]MDQ0269180.1 DNA-binding transcriptional regulator LsrR (DeoR family) [Cytobacillus purgationiresistens]
MAQDVYSKSMLTKVAWYYYKEDLTQNEIADYLGLTRNQVVRHLEKAKTEGIIQFHIYGMEANCLEIKKKLVSHFQLKDAYIIPAPKNKADIRQSLAKAAAQTVQSNLTENDLIGIGWGQAALQTVDQLSIDPAKNISIVTLTGGVNHYFQNRNHHSEGGFQGKIFAIPAPFMASTDEMARLLLTEPSVADILDLASLAKHVIVGIGSLAHDSTIVIEEKLTIKELAYIRNQQAVGDILGQFFDIEGKIIDLPLHKRLIGASLNKLKEMNVIAVAGGEEKVNAIYGALKGQYISTLITDEETAAALMKLGGD